MAKKKLRQLAIQIDRDKAIVLLEGKLVTLRKAWEAQKKKQTQMKKEYDAWHKKAIAFACKELGKLKPSTLESDEIKWIWDGYFYVRLDLHPTKAQLAKLGQSPMHPDSAEVMSEYSYTGTTEKLKQVIQRLKLTTEKTVAVDAMGEFVKQILCNNEL